MLRNSGWSTLRVIGLSSGIAALLLAPAIPGLLQPQNLQGFLGALLLGGSLNALAFWSYGRAIALEDLSLVLPLINLSPLVLLFSGWWVLGERPSLAAVLGVGLLVIGALLLGHSQSRSGLRFGDLKPLWSSQGCRWMLLVAVVWGVCASIDKLGVQAGGSLLWVLSLQLVIGSSLLGLSLKGRLDHKPTSSVEPRIPGVALTLVVAGAAGALGTLGQMEAINQTAVVHVIAIKRLSTLMGSGAGIAALGESNGRERLTAATLMVLGAATVLLGAAMQ